MSRKDKKTVVDTIMRLKGVTKIVNHGYNSHGPTITFVFCGEEFTYGYDWTPKSTYSEEKTRKGIRHSILAKANSKGFTPDDVYTGTEWRT